MPDEDTPPPTQPPPSPIGPTGSTASFVPPSIEELQAALPQYEVLKMIGMGGMGAVFKANQTNLDRLVAIKVLPSGLDLFGHVPNPSGEAVSGSSATLVAERFQREAQAMAKMHHPRIIAVHDFGKTDDYLYIVMEFVEGTDLSDIIRGEQTLGHEQTLAIVTQICDALQYAHEKGVVHRDIKPANIMLDVNGQVKIADFGLAKLTGADHAQITQLTMTNMAMGTPDYVAPEALEIGTEVDHRADIYSLGVMLYQLLTGSIPRGMFQPASERAEGIDPRLDDVVARALESQPERRYQNVTEFWTDIDHIRTTPNTNTLARQEDRDQHVSIKPGLEGRTREVTLQTATRPPRKISLLWTVSGLVLLALFGALAWTYFAPKEEKDLANSSEPSPQAKSKKGPSSRGMENRDSFRDGQGPPSEKPPPSANGPGRFNPAFPRTGPGKPPNKGMRKQLPPRGDPVEVLSLIDPEQDTLIGTWSQGDNGTLIHTAEEGYARIDAPFRLSGPYRIRIVYTGVQPGRQVGIGFPAGNNSVMLRIDGSREVHASGLALVDGIMPDADTENSTFSNWFVHNPDREHVLELSVRPHGENVSIKAELDGRSLVEWSGPQASLRMPPLYMPGTPVEGIAFTCARNNVTLLNATLQLLEGAAIKFDRSRE